MNEYANLFASPLLFSFCPELPSCPCCLNFPSTRAVSWLNICGEREETCSRSLVQSAKKSGVSGQDLFASKLGEARDGKYSG